MFVLCSRKREESSDHAKRKKVFFSEEKKQKTFVRWCVRSPERHAKIQKFFGSFFQERTSSLRFLS
jgi:hypothetical protein